MKIGIHPQTLETKVHCNSCGNDFVSSSTVKAIEVEICSNCHPFYTGKQKLIDTANRVAKFEARRAAKAQLDEKAAATLLKKDGKLAAIAEEIKDETVDAKTEV